mmetsp:Transcript_3534/g.10870  ORF Transcript_3534/g.10870 Transcript_3534/m.10870 type:complete len:227 (+) Transcript_3534:49-729(+)
MRAVRSKACGDGFCYPYHRVATAEESYHLAVVVALCLTFSAALLAPRLVAAALHSSLTARAPQNLVTIALTGGPCAGKTSALTALEASAKSAGFHLMVTTEIATLMRAGGCDEAITPACVSDLARPAAGPTRGRSGRRRRSDGSAYDPHHRPWRDGRQVLHVPAYMECGARGHRRHGREPLEPIRRGDPPCHRRGWGATVLQMGQRDGRLRALGVSQGIARGGHRH